METEEVKTPYVFIILMLIVASSTLIYMKPKIDSINNGGPIIPEECRNGFRENVTYTTQVVTNYFWSDKCCTKRLVGRTNRNNYETICWDKSPRINEERSKDD